MKNKRDDTQSLDRLEIPRSWPPPGTEVQAINHLEDPQKCRDWILVTDLKAIEYYLLLRNRLHFGQAHGTPFTIPPLSEDLDWAASTSTADAVLKGTYRTTLQNHQSQALLAACTSRVREHEPDALLTMAELIGKLRVWRHPQREDTGHFHSLALER